MIKGMGGNRYRVYNEIFSLKKFSPELDTNTKHFLPFHHLKFQWESRNGGKKKKE